MTRLRALLGLTVVLLFLGVLQIGLRLNNHLALLTSYRWLAAFGLAVFCLLFSLGLLFASWSPNWSRWVGVVESLQRVLEKLGLVNLIFAGFAYGIYAFLMLGPVGENLSGLAVRLSFFWLAACAGAFFLKATFPARNWSEIMLGSALLSGLVYQVAVFIPDISTYPFSLSWSEVSRYYNASLFFSERIYGKAVPLPVLHPSRYLMQSVPFLISGLPLWAHRLWQVLLWLALPVLTAAVLAKRLDLKQQPARILFLAWAFLFMFQGPVYYHLLVAVVVVLTFFDARKFWFSLLIVLLASVWAGISRINWFPMPGMLAASLYLLEVGLPPRKAVQYVLKPALWFVLGTATAFGTQSLYVLLSGEEANRFSSSFTSDLLWYRLFPNATFRIGILPAVLLISAPILVYSWQKLRRLHPLRLLGLSAILAVLFAGGVVVSTKIGGGSNLHNLDAYLVILLIVGGYAFANRAGPDPITEMGEAVQRTTNPFQPRYLLPLVALVPVVVAAGSGGPVTHPSNAEANQELATLRTMVEQAASQGGEVLFISQRHLLTFKLIPGVALVEPYEDVFLMEMAMAGNQEYLNQLYRDLDSHRFAIIISDPVRDRLKGRSFSFGEENDAWVKRVGRPILKDYKSVLLFKEAGIEIFTPKP